MVGKSLVEEKSPVEESDLQRYLKLTSYEAQALAQMQWDRAQIWWRHPHPFEQPWSWFHLCSRKAPPQKCTSAVTQQPPSNLPGKIPPGRWHWFGQSSVPTTLHASWPVWLAYVHTFQSALVPPG